jgi:hypothetical protein
VGLLPTNRWERGHQQFPTTSFPVANGILATSALGPQ